MNAILIHEEKKPASACFSASNEPCCHNFLTFNESYRSNVTPFGEVNAEKVAEAVFSMYLR